MGSGLLVAFSELLAMLKSAPCISIGAISLTNNQLSLCATTTHLRYDVTSRSHPDGTRPCFLIMVQGLNWFAVFKAEISEELLVQNSGAAPRSSRLIR